jgi:hypothetical protein
MSEVDYLEVSDLDFHLATQFSPFFARILLAEVLRINSSTQALLRRDTLSNPT